MRHYDVLTSGYVSFDHMLKIASPATIGFTSLILNKSNVKISFGGCSVNIASALDALGLRAMPIIRVGGDYESSGFLDFLEKKRIPTKGITKIADEITPISYLIQDVEGKHITLFYPGAMDGKYASPIPDDFFGDVSLGVLTVGAYEDNLDFFNKCVHHNIPLIFGMKSDFLAFPEQFLRQILNECHILFMNDEEYRTISGLLKIDNITDIFGVSKCKIIVITHGKNGSSFYSHEEKTIKKGAIPIYTGGKIEDATGSGDGYMAGFIYAYLKGYNTAECCAMGSVLASFVLEKEGCCTNLPAENILLERYRTFIQCENQKEQW